MENAFFFSLKLRYAFCNASAIQKNRSPFLAPKSLFAHLIYSELKAVCVILLLTANSISFMAESSSFKSSMLAVLADFMISSTTVENFSWVGALTK